MIDKHWVRRSFDRASATFDGAAVLQAQARHLLLERLDWTTLDPRIVLDVGAGTGHACRALKRRYAGARVIALDSSYGMLCAAGRQQSWLRRFARVCADAAQLPLPDGSVDLLVSNLLLPWADVDEVLREWRRVLAPRGLITFTTLGPDTLREYRAAWRTAGRHDAHDPAAGVPFMDMHDIGDALVRAGFAAPVLDVERYTLKYRDVAHLAADLKASGARNPAAGRNRGLIARATFAAMQAAYEEQRDEGRLPATCEVVFGQAWGPVGARANDPHTAHVPLADLQRQLGARRDS